jgi:hypothetical protein
LQNFLNVEATLRDRFKVTEQILLTIFDHHDFCLV